MDRYCRICARVPKDKEMVSLYCERNGEVIANMMIDCADIMVCHDDELPENVCTDCLARLEDAYALRKLIRDSDSSLRELSAKQVSGVATADEDAPNQKDPLAVMPSERSVKRAGKTIMYPSDEQVENVTTFDTYKVLRLKGLRCCGCERTFPSKEELTAHSTAEHSPKEEQNTEDNKPIFQCGVCYERFSTRMKLLNHTKNYESNEIYHCTVCDILFDIKYRLQQHFNLNKRHRAKPDASHSTGDESSSKGKKRAGPVRKRVTKELKYPDQEYILSIDDNPEYQIIYVGGERCCGCDEIFQTYAELQEHCTEKHPEIESDEDPFCECSLCHKKFDQIQAYNRHNSARVQKELYFCKFCDLVIDIKFRFEQHLKTSVAHHTALDKAGIKSTYPLEEQTQSGTRSLESLIEVLHVTGLRCCGCNFDCATQEELEDHSEEAHGFMRVADTKVNPYECNICFERFSESNLLQYHQNLASQKTLYKCARCDIQSEIKSRILQHLTSSEHSGEDFSKPPKPKSNVLMCCFARCQVRFEDANELLEHVEAEHDSKRRENAAEREYDAYICYVCHRSFRNQKSLELHQFPRPRKEFGPLSCSVCGASFQTETGMAAHERSHSLVRYFECDVCEKTFPDERSLRGHKISHDAKKPFKCDVCPKAFRRKGNLKVHKRCHRPGIWQCPHCEKKFKTKQSLLLHIRSHTGEKPFQCRYCDNRYSHTTDRQRHEMATHTNERPHKCKDCPAEFVRKRQLTIHERLHTGERPFVCKICNRGFIQVHYLTRHMETHEKQAQKEEHVVFEIEELQEESDDDQQQDQFDLMEVLEEEENE